jgi:isochorismate synthase EntC
MASGKEEHSCGQDRSSSLITLYAAPFQKGELTAWRPSSYAWGPRLTGRLSRRPLSLSYFPPRESWEALAEEALGAIGEREIDKIVLARKTVALYDEPIDPVAVLGALSRWEEATLFALSLSPASCWVGATPERLLSKKGTGVEIDALAGTALEAPLLAEKERREWAWVERSIRERLPDVPLTASPPSIRSAGPLRHFASSLTGVTDASARSLAEQLYPTAALAGYPVERASDWLHIHEPFNRELYGGIIGWEGEGAAYMEVAIRCCKIEEKQVTFYTGAGLVEGSDPAKEWEELNHKLSPYRGILL